MSEILGTLEAPSPDHEQIAPGAPVNVGGIMVFDAPPGGPPDLEDLRAALSTRMGALRRYSQRLTSLRAGHFLWPRWEPDPQFEIGHNIDHAVLRSPCDDRQLWAWAARFFSDSADRHRPLWELILLEGLPEGRWALAHKVNHRLSEGLGSVDVIGLLLDDRPGVVGGPSPFSRSSPFATRAPDGFEPWLKVPPGQPQHYALVRAPLAELKDVANVLGGSLNDVILAASAGGVRRLLLERGEQVSTPLHALPVDEPLTPVRVARIASRRRRLNTGRTVRRPITLVGAAGRAPSLVTEMPIARGRFSTPLFTVKVVSVSGPAEPVCAFGAPLREVLPVVPLPAPGTVGIAIFTYDGMVSLGLSAIEDSVPDLDVLAAGIEASLEELRAYGT